jgi:hypothetical protein
MNSCAIALVAGAALRVSRRIIAGATLPAALLGFTVGCSDSPSGPDEAGPGSFLLITSVPNQSGSDGASFVQTVGLDQPQVSNAGAFEQTFRPYPYVNGNDVILLQGYYGDQAARYVRGNDGRLTESGRMSLPPGSVGAGVVYASATKAYLALTNAGKVLIFNPQTMTSTGEIDLTTLGIARNPANPSDRNPEPVALAIRDGKLFVTLAQLVNNFASADGADIAVFDLATDRFEKVMRDSRTAACGTFGYYQSFFVDEQGDLYVYCIASYGFVPGQKGGILRVRRGQTEFDPGYFLNVTDAAVGVPGGRVGFMALPAYAGNGQMYGIAEVPALASNPPSYARDRNFQAVHVDLYARQITALPLPPGNGVGTGVAMSEGRVIFGLSTATGVGLYSYDPATGQASNGPVVTTAGDPTHLIAFE